VVDRHARYIETDIPFLPIDCRRTAEDSVVRQKGFAMRIVFVSMLCSLSAGCCVPVEPTWSQKTRNENRWFLHRASGLRIGYRQYPGRADLPLVVFSHGLAHFKQGWKQVGESLASDGHPVVLIDLIGHGDSEIPGADSGWYRTSEQGAMLTAFVEELRRTGSKKIVLAGLSYGGATSLECARRFHEAGNGGAIAGVFAVAPAAYRPGDAIMARINRSVAFGGLIGRLMPACARAGLFVRIVLKSTFHNPRRISFEDANEVRSHYLDASARLSAVAAMKAMLKEFDERAGESGRFSAIRCPVTILRGAQDTIIDRNVVETLHRDLLPHGNVELIEVDDVGHAFPNENPTETLRHLRNFLATSKRMKEETGSRNSGCPRSRRPRRPFSAVRPV